MIAPFTRKRPRSGILNDTGERRHSRGRMSGAPVPDTLRALYDQYCRGEVEALLRMVPREGLRSLWRNRGVSMADRTSSAASLDELKTMATEILPLPPYEVWLRSYLRDRKPYLDRLGVPAAPSRSEPVTVSTREIGAEIWVHLNLSIRGEGWVGFLAFHGPGVIGASRTGDIFRGDSPDEILERFHEFNHSTLQAFLRSVSG